MVRRREFIRISAAASVGLLASVGLTTAPGRLHASRAYAAPKPPANLAAITKFTEQLPIPPAIDATSGGSIALSMRPGAQVFHTALPATPTYGYSASYTPSGAGAAQNAGLPYLGPTIVTKRGKPITVTATNDLGAHPLAGAIDTGVMGAVTADRAKPRASVHLHGGHTQAASDGSPLDVFVAGTKTYNYFNGQEAANLWYHDHALGITRLNVFAGLAAGYLIRDTWDTGQAGAGQLQVPTGSYEIPLIIQDRMFNADGTFLYPPGVPTPDDDPITTVWSPEFFGDVATVNGKAWPNLNVHKGLYRFRIYNGSNARAYNLSLGKNRVMWQIGTDGGLLPAPAQLKQLLLMPGERADVLIDFSGEKTGERIVLTNDAPSPFPNGPRALHRGGVPLPEIMQFTVTATVQTPALTVPATLRATPITALAAPTVIREMTLVEVLDPESGPVLALINNQEFTPTVASGNMAKPAANSVERWDIINTTGDAHPIHLHLVQFQVLNRQKFNAAKYAAAAYPTLGPTSFGTGPWPSLPVAPYLQGGVTGPAPNERGWKDTVRAMPGEVTRIMIPFSGNVGGPYDVPTGGPFTGLYVWHCHILEHEDHDMMQPYQVV